MRATEFINEVKIDNNHGWGVTPNNKDIDYFGLRVKMKPSVFLKLSSPLLEPTSKEDIKKHLLSGGSIASPFLLLGIPSEWREGDFSTPATVNDHDGRNRMLAILDLEGDNPVEVHLFPNRGLRTKTITAGMIDSLNKALYPQGLSFKTIRGPYFSMDKSIEEDWKSKVASAGLGAALTLGSVGLKNKTDILPQPVQQAQQAIAKAIPMTAEKTGHYLENFLQKVGISGNELAAFMSQAAHETMNFSKMEEMGSDEAIAKKYDPTLNPRKAKILGNTDAGDGVKFKGRGFLQITGRYNYKMAGKALGLPLEDKPELLEKPEIAAKAALWYWNARVKNKVKNFTNVKQTTKNINPGLKGLADRIKYFKQYSAPTKNKNTK